jgi:L-alanine-DL-glutamate epimerase-like enolase superfamily enzyme
MNNLRFKFYKLQAGLKRALVWGKSSKISMVEHLVLELSLDGEVAYVEIPVRPTIYGETKGSIIGFIKMVFPKIQSLYSEYHFSNLFFNNLWNNIYTNYPYNYAAKGCLDMALWYLWIQSGSCEVYNNIDYFKKVKISYILGVKPELDAMSEMSEKYKQGIRLFKVKLKQENWENTFDFIKNALDEFSDDLEIYIDANQTLDEEHAFNVLDSLAKIGVVACEEPVDIKNYRLRKTIHEANIMPIIADDSIFSKADLERELKVGPYFDFVNIKTPRSGFTETFQITDIFKDHEIGILLGSNASLDLGAYYTYLVSNAIDIPIHSAEASFCLNSTKESIIDPKLDFKDGYLLDQKRELSEQLKLNLLEEIDDI